MSFRAGKQMDPNKNAKSVSLLHAVSSVGSTKDHKIGICCFFVKEKELRIMCQSGATCLPADCCFSELAL
jgi:hypothetical protein